MIQAVVRHQRSSAEVVISINSYKQLFATDTSAQASLLKAQVLTVRGWVTLGGTADSRVGVEMHYSLHTFLITPYRILINNIDS